MTTGPLVPQQNEGDVAFVGKQKPEDVVEWKNRRVLGDIGNLMNACRIERKPRTQVTRPVARHFGAQLLFNVQAVGAANKKSSPTMVVEDFNAQPELGRVKPTDEPPVVIEISSDSEGEEIQRSLKTPLRKEVHTLTSVLTARSRIACKCNAVDDIDAADSEDHLAVVEYVEDIYNFYRMVEKSSGICDYMGSQMEINEKMRSILIDWLIEVHNKFDLMPETLYLTVHIVDRYLSKRMVIRKELQLVGITAMLIASKYEEIWSPPINDFVCICDKAYCREKILKMEKNMLNQLEWSLTLPTPYAFLLRFLKAAGNDLQETKHLAFFFAELALMQYYCMVNYSPSMVAASALYAAHCTLNKSPLWSDTLRHHTGFTDAQIRDCAKVLVIFHSTISEVSYKLKVVYKKYSSPKCGAVALLPPATKLFEEESKFAAC